MSASHSNYSDCTFREFIVNADSNQQLLTEQQQFSDAEIFALYSDRSYSPMTARQISELTGKSLGSIYRIIDRYGGPTRRGTNYHLISNYASQGLPAKDIAERVGYTRRGIHNILKRMNNGNQSE